MVMGDKERAVLPGVDTTGWVVQWHAYGAWKQTSFIWAFKAAAEKHAKMLAENEWNLDITVKLIELPEAKRITGYQG